MTKVKMWRCRNCGHEVIITPDLDGLIFEQYSNRTSKVQCTACGSYTIQKAHNDDFTAGDFLIVKSFYGRK